MCDKIDSFLEEISSLPRWLNRSLSLLRDLDLKSQTSGERAQHHRARYFELARARLESKRECGEASGESALGCGGNSFLYDDPELQAEAAEAHKLGREAQALMREKVIVLNQVLRVIRGEAESFKCSLAKFAREVGEEVGRQPRRVVGGWVEEGGVSGGPSSDCAGISTGVSMVGPSTSRAVVKSSSSLQGGFVEQHNCGTSAAAPTEGPAPTTSSSEVYRPFQLNLSNSLGGAAGFGAAALRNRAVKRNPSRPSPSSSTVETVRLGKRARLATPSSGVVEGAALELKKPSALKVSSSFVTGVSALPSSPHEPSSMLSQEGATVSASNLVGETPLLSSSRHKRVKHSPANDGVSGLVLSEGAAGPASATGTRNAPTATAVSDPAFREALHAEQAQQTAKHNRQPPTRVKKQSKETNLSDIADSPALTPAAPAPVCESLGSAETLCGNSSSETPVPSDSQVSLQVSALPTPGASASQQQLLLSKTNKSPAERGKSSSRNQGTRASVLKSA